MTDLMIKRFLVIAEWPEMEIYNFKKDEIISLSENTPDLPFVPKSMRNKPCTGFRNSKSFGMKYFDNYPHLFKKLEWLEHRNVSELPKYVLCTKTPDQVHKPNRIYKVEWNSVWGYDTETTSPIVVSTNCFLPSTEQEFINQNNK